MTRCRTCGKPILDGEAVYGAAWNEDLDEGEHWKCKTDRVGDYKEAFVEFDKSYKKALKSIEDLKKIMK